MKESISYTFLLNIIILFIFVCAAIVMGVFSYYRAFKANSIVVNAIEKYEGFNCLSEQEAATKLNNISYNVPFNVTCKESYGKPCMTDLNGNYAVVSYNIDYSSGEYVKVANDFKYEENKRYYDMNSQYDWETGEQTNRYQYGVYTYMYVDVPVIGSLIKIPFYSKTKYLYEYRDINKTSSNENANFYDRRNTNKERLIDFEVVLMGRYAQASTGGIKFDPEYNSRLEFQYMPNYASENTGNQPDFVAGGYRYKCGALRDYSKY